MTTALVCLMLRLSVPVTLGMHEAIATDPALRWGVHVRLSPQAAHYLRSETWEPAHPRTRCHKRKGRRTRREMRP